jgi:hypothetical protein
MTSLALAAVAASAIGLIVILTVALIAAVLLRGK